MDLTTIAQKNSATFMRYRVFFRARYYYPIFTLLFLDFGLTLSQFAILNSVWALTIVIFEIPLGGLADTIGRRKIIILSAILLNLELLVWLFAPINGGDALFTFFLINRILSGFCEAASSGADEAIAYDSLEKAGLKDQWPKVMEKTQRYTSLYFMFVLLVGASVYDPNFVTAVFRFFGGQSDFTQTDCIKFPIVLNLFAAIYVLINAFKFEEHWENKMTVKDSLKLSFKNIFHSLKWIRKTSIVIVIILFLTFTESLILQFLTLMQQYWKVIDIPIVFYGIIGSVLALFASAIPSLGKVLYDKFTLKTNFVACYSALIIAFSFIALSIPLYGVLPVVLLYCTYNLITYFNSCYLNKHCLEKYRATILSVQNMLSFSKYGIISILYSFIVAVISKDLGESTLSEVFSISLIAFPVYFVISTLTAFVIVRSYLRYRKPAI